MQAEVFGSLLACDLRWAAGMRDNRVGHRMRRLLVVAIALLAAGCVFLRPRRATLDERLDRLVGATEHDGSAIGVLVVDAATGRVVYAHRAHERLIPASTLKLLTTSAILAALGPDYRFRTAFSLTGPVSGGVFDGDLVIAASGDPSFGSWRWPETAPEATCDRVAQALAARGIRTWAGAVRLAISADDRAELGPGWAWDDAAEDFSAPPTRFVFRENVVDLRLSRPGHGCDAPPTVAWDPPIAAMVADVVLDPSATKSSLDCLRVLGGERIACTWRTPARGCPRETEVPVAVDDPRALFAAYLDRALTRAHVVHRPPIVGPQAPSSLAVAQPLITLESPPLSELVKATNKESLNLYAERFALFLTQMRAGTESYAALGETMHGAAQKLGVSGREVVQVDGSGLSRYDLATPAALVQVLRASLASSYGAAYLASLPISGVDGTLAHRTPKGEARGRVHAKTGSMTGVHAWAGVTVRPNDHRHPRLVFAIQIDGLDHPTVPADAFFDRAADALVTAPIR